MFKKTIRSLGITALVSSTYFNSALAQSTEGVWKHHIEAWEKRSVEAIASGYSDEAVLIVNNKIFQGPEQVKNVFSQLFAIFDNGKNRIDTPVLLGRFIYITWHSTPSEGPEFFGTDTFVVENGKIILQTIASELYDAFSFFSLNE